MRYKGKHSKKSNRIWKVVGVTIATVAIALILLTPNAEGRTISGISWWMESVNNQLADHENRITNLELGCNPTTTSTSTTVPPTTTTTTTTLPPTTSSTTTTSTTITTTSTTIPPTTTTTSTTDRVDSGPFYLRSDKIYSNYYVTAGGATVGVYGDGLSNVNVNNMTITGGKFSMKLGGGPISRNVSINGLTTIDNQYTSLYVDCVQDSVFENLNLTSPKISGTNQAHTLYVESDCSNLLFKNSSFKGGSGYTVHLYLEGNSSRNITFSNCIIDARTGNVPIVVASGFDGVNFINCTVYGNSNRPIIVFYGGNNVLFEGCTFYGGQQLLYGGTDGPSKIKDCIYYGSNFGSAANVTLENTVLAQ